MRPWIPMLLIALVPAIAAAQQEGTVKPGMSQAEVEAAWGKPLAARSKGDFTYLYYANGCLKTCGIHDVVILEKGQVVDAIVRANYHHYEGVSSSPSERKPAFTKPAAPGS